MLYRYDGWKVFSSYSANYEIRGLSEMLFLPTTSPIMQMAISVGVCECEQDKRREKWA